MNSIKVKLEQIVSIDNCREALLQAAKRKSHRRDVRKILNNLDEYAVKLSNFLSAEQPEFHCGNNVLLKSKDPSKKDRTINKPKFFPDHCAHWAIMRQLGQEFEKRYYPFSCASIKGRGTDFARKLTTSMMNDTKNTKYCLQTDIRHFYVSVDKDLLVEMLKKKIKDSRVVNLLAGIIYAYKELGLPLGWYTSSFLANYFLTPLDNLVKQKCKVPYMVRYMDDMVMFSPNKKELHKTAREMQTWAAEHNLTIKKNWQVYKMPYKKPSETWIVNERRRACDFIGYKQYRYKVTVRRSTHYKIGRCASSIRKGHYNQFNAARYFSRLGYLKHSDSRRRRKSLNVSEPALGRIIGRTARRNNLYKTQSTGTVTVNDCQGVK